MTTTTHHSTTESLLLLILLVVLAVAGFAFAPRVADTLQKMMQTTVKSPRKVSL